MLLEMTQLSKANLLVLRLRIMLPAMMFYLWPHWSDNSTSWHHCGHSVTVRGLGDGLLLWSVERLSPEGLKQWQPSLLRLKRTEPVPSPHLSALGQ